MRHESLYLTDIVEAADHVAEFIAGTDFPAFQESELLRSAVSHTFPRLDIPSDNP
jgi:uncharacterized protein with HEPN domain